jgi:hypothetical protein
MEYVLELQKNVDYMTPTWCAESLVDFVSTFTAYVIFGTPPEECEGLIH